MRKELQTALRPGLRVTDGVAMYIITDVTTTTDGETQLPATLHIDALSVIEVEKREAEYARMLHGGASR